VEVAWEPTIAVYAVILLILGALMLYMRRR
jgi:hypothetical protein